jgi:hypothetical protein
MRDYLDDYLCVLVKNHILDSFHIMEWSLKIGIKYYLGQEMTRQDRINLLISWLDNEQIHQVNRTCPSSV